MAEHLSLGVRLEAEKEKGGGEVKVHLASSVDEAGTLAVAPVGLPHRETLDRQRASLLVRYRTPGVPGLSWAIGGLVGAGRLRPDRLGRRSAGVAQVLAVL